MDVALVNGTLGAVVTRTVDVEGTEEEVVIDPLKGPRVHQVDGSTGYLSISRVPLDYVNEFHGERKERHKRSGELKPWRGMSSTEQQIMCTMAAKKNRRMREWKGTDFFGPELAIWASDVAASAQALKAAQDAQVEEEEVQLGPGDFGGHVEIDKELRQRIEERAEEVHDDFFLYCMKYRPLGYPVANPKLRIICFHNAGSTESNYTGNKTPFVAWAAAHGGVEIVAPDYPGRNKLLKREKHTSIDSLAPELLAVLFEKLADGVPYMIWSHSVGTWVAFEVLLLARKIGLPMPMAALFMAFPAPHMPVKSRKWRRSALLNDPQFKGELVFWDKSHFKGAGKVVFEYPFWGRDWEPLMRADFRLFDEYKFKHDGVPKFDFPVHAWHFSEEHYNEAWMIQMWMDWTTSVFETREMQGMGHLSCFTNADQKACWCILGQAQPRMQLG